MSNADELAAESGPLSGGALAGAVIGGLFGVGILVAAATFALAHVLKRRRWRSNSTHVRKRHTWFASGREGDEIELKGGFAGEDTPADQSVVDAVEVALERDLAAAVQASLETNGDASLAALVVEADQRQRHSSSDTDIWSAHGDDDDDDVEIEDEGQQLVGAVVHALDNGTVAIEMVEAKPAMAEATRYDHGNGQEELIETDHTTRQEGNQEQQHHRHHPETKLMTVQHKLMQRPLRWRSFIGGGGGISSINSINSINSSSQFDQRHKRRRNKQVSVNEHHQQFHDCGDFDDKGIYNATENHENDDENDDIDDVDDDDNDDEEDILCPARDQFDFHAEFGEPLNCAPNMWASDSESDTEPERSAVMNKENENRSRRGVTHINLAHEAAMTLRTGDSTRLGAEEEKQTQHLVVLV